MRAFAALAGARAHAVRRDELGRSSDERRGEAVFAAAVAPVAEAAARMPATPSPFPTKLKYMFSIMDTIRSISYGKVQADTMDGIVIQLFIVCGRRLLDFVLLHINHKLTPAEREKPLPRAKEWLAHILRQSLRDGVAVCKITGYSFTFVEDEAYARLGKK